MNLVFVSPHWLWLLVLVPLFWFVPRRAARHWHATIRSAVAILLILALGRPAVLTEQGDSYQVLLWDRSESVRAPTSAAVDAWLARLPATSRARVVTLGARRDAAPEIDGVVPLQLGGDSSIGRGLAAAARLIPEGATGAVTVLSDGMATDPHWGDAVRQLVERGIPVHTVAVPRSADEVYPSAIRTRPPVRVGETARVAVDVIGTAGEVVVSLLADGSLLARSTPFAATQRTTVELEFEPARAGLLDVTAEVQVVTGTDLNPDNNRLASTLAVQEPIKALYLSERLTGSRDRMNALTGPGVELSEPSEARLQELAKDPEGLAAYDLVVIDDRPAESVPLTVQEAIVGAVRNDGVGLFYAGGKGAFGTGGYFDTPMAAILPVEMIQKEEKRDPSTTLVVIIDTSGSMSGERVQLAKECARLAIRRLLPHDKVGIVEFYGTKQWAAPIQSAANAIDIQRAINRMDAGGGTVILPAIEEAFYAMQNVQTRYKHVLVLTDGGVESGDFESLLRRMAARGINVSTVLVGSDAHSEFLVNLANWGKGHFYSASSRFNIPEVLLKQPSTSKIPPYRPGEHLVRMGGPSGWWGDIPRPGNPRLAGYVETRLRPGAQVAIETETERHPVLASWRYGLGRVSAFTTEPVGEGTAPWREWDGYGAWLMRALARTSREHPQPFVYAIERTRAGARVVARHLTSQAHLPAAERIDATGAAEPLVFQQRSPDVFTATLLEDARTTIHLRAGAAGWPGRKAHLVSPAWQAAAPEHNVDPGRAVDLAALASATGGQAVTLATVARLTPTPGGAGSATDLHRLWPWCLVLALLAYLGDILHRRWPGTAAPGPGGAASVAMIIGLVLLSAPALEAEVSPALEAKLQQTLRQDPFVADSSALHAAALLEDESLDPLLARLDAIIAADKQSFEAIWLAASLKWRYGLLDEALELFQRSAGLRPEPVPLFRVAQVLDARGRTADAATQYLKALEAKPDPALAGRIQLRLALLKSAEDNIGTVEEDLAAYAARQDQAFQNRAGVVLALTGRPKEALALYKPTDDAGEAFKQLIRIAEWSIAAGDLARAQESAWGALRSARLQRDRRYALTVLAEAYRTDKKLDTLIERFAATPDLSAEARMTWIELLREQGDVAQALALFREAKADGAESFTADMRREMLEICREAGRNDLLITNYQEMIAKEPRRLEWRSGLCRFHLERGERDQGLAVWKDFKDQAKRSDWLAAAGAAMELGLDELAQSFAEELVQGGRGTERLAALQFLFDLHKSRGREDAMRAALARMDELAAPDASERARLAESWEQLGRQDKAIEVLEHLRAARGADDFSPDLETRLAWLYSETGAEELAYDAWKRVWLRIDSPGRRRYIEDRFMATASRLGKLADIAIELEEKLADGRADKRDSALLVRLYTKAGDPVSASEIIHDFMKQSGGDEIRMLEEQARVYVMCNDYYHYEKTLRKLMQLDPEGTPEYYTQLAMSALERGRNDEARAILTEMRDLEQNPASAEFEAGVLKIAGMHQEANAAYWRGIAEHPDRIDTYLLLGGSLQGLGKGSQATGLFQYLVENADEDDLFTIAIDGLLNMNNPRQGSQLTPETLRWARRAILERLASRDDKVYLFQLLSDVSEDLRDRNMMIRTLAETLPVAGERRTAQLRELMELAKAGSSGKDGMMRFGRRLVGMGEVIPPQVYLDLGSVFLDSGDILNALKTFDQAGGGLDQAAYQRKVAGAFEQKRYVRSALRSYEQLLVTAPDDVGVLAKVGELKEQLGRGDEAAIAYRRALDLLVAGQPLFSIKGKQAADSRSYYYSRNVDRFDQYYLRVLTGFLATSDPGGPATSDLVDDAIAALESDLQRLEQERATVGSGGTLGLENVPRIARRSSLIRRLALGDGQLARARSLEELMLAAFPTDATLLPDICRTWDDWGYTAAARDLATALPDNPGHAGALEMLGDMRNGGIRELFQLVLNGDDRTARSRLRDVEELMKQDGGGAGFRFLFTMARHVNDPAAVERLTRLAISRAPRSQRLAQSIQMLSMALPSLDQQQRDRLIAHVESLIAEQDAAAGSSAYYYYPRLKQLTGKDLRLPAETIRPEIEKMLARGGPYNRYVASMFTFLDGDDYRGLLTDTYRKAKASDRLALVIALVRQYPGTLNPGMQATFLELAGDAMGSATEDPLRLYQTNAPNRYLGGVPNDANAGFEALLLGKLAEGTPQDKQLDYRIEQVRAWHRAGDTARAMEAAGRTLEASIDDEKVFGKVLDLLRGLPSEYLDGLLAALDAIEKAKGPAVALEQKRLQLVRLARDPDRLLATLRESIRKLPGETTFRQELRKELDQQGRHFEAIAVLEGLAALEPDETRHRSELREAWNRLAHPLKAGKAMTPEDSPAPEQGDQAIQPVTATAKTPPPTPQPAKPAAAPAPPPTKAAGGSQEKPLAMPSIQLVKTHYEAGELDQAGLTFRQLWRQFATLDRAGGHRIFSMPSQAHSRYYAWPAESEPSTRTSPAPPSGSGQDSLKGFLAMTPEALPEPPRATQAGETVFSKIGAEEFMAAELRTWLRTFEPRNFQAPLFDDLVGAVTQRQIDAQGVEAFVTDALARFQNGELSALDQNALLAALTLHPEAGGGNAAAFLQNRRATLDPGDLWTALRLARCLVRRGDEDAALALYRWCGANAGFSSFISSNQASVTASHVVDEIRSTLDGPSRLRVLEAVLPVITSDPRYPSANTAFPQFILSTWAQELAVHEVCQRCPEMCRQIVHGDSPEQGRTTTALEMATLFLAAGGESEDALAGLGKLLIPASAPPAPGRSTSRRNPGYEPLLRKLLPDDMASWTDPDQWLSGLARQIQVWHADRQLTTNDAVKILSIVAVRQHQNGFHEAAQATLATTRSLPLTNPKTANWLLDAAELTGSQDLAIELGSTLLRERRLPIRRVASLMDAVATTQGAPAALALAEATLDYTWEPGFLDTMASIAAEAGDDEAARAWQDRHRQVAVPRATSGTPEDGDASAEQRQAQ